MTTADSHGRSDAPANDERAPSAALRVLPLVVIGGALALGYAFGIDRFLSLHALIAQRGQLVSFVAAHRIAAMAGFLAVYACAVALSFPAASILTVVGGFLFGWAVGGTLTVVAATLGATILFLAARFAFRDILSRRAGPFLARFSGGFEDNAFGYLLALRLAPVFPFFIVNVAPAFFDIGLGSYVAATALGILPGTFVYAYLGAGLDTAIASAARAGREAALSDLVTPEITGAFVLLALVAALPAVIRSLRARR